jgi:hypothetical protein
MRGGILGAAAWKFIAGSVTTVPNFFGTNVP